MFPPPASHCACHDTPKPPPPTPSLKAWLLLPPRLLAASLDGAAEVVRRTLHEDWPAPRDGDCCAIPEHPCPDPVVSRVSWSGCAGDAFRQRLRVINRGKQEQTFELIASAFESACGFVDHAPQLDVTGAVLAPGADLQALLSFTIPATLEPGEYRARVRITGGWTQVVEVRLCVSPASACCLVVEQGEKPVQIKAHQWYHHFQHSEVCPS